jgi:hypothetical protein
MRNIFKELIRKRKIKENNSKVTNYGKFSIECVYHNNFIKIMNDILLMDQNQSLLQNPDIYNMDQVKKTVVKNEEVLLNFANKKISDSVLCSIFAKIEEQRDDNKELAAKDIFNSDIESFSNIIIQIKVEYSTDSMMHLLDCLPILASLTTGTNTNTKDSIFILTLNGTYSQFMCIRPLLEKEINNGNIICRRLIECINSTIPDYLSDYSGNEYFKSLDDTVPSSIDGYADSLFKIQVLSNDNIMDKEYIKENVHKDAFYKMQYLYLIIDNLSSKFFFTDAVYRTKYNNRYIIKLSYYYINEFINCLLEEKGKMVNSDIVDNIESKIKEIIPTEVLEETTSLLNKNAEEDNSFYADVDEIIN